MATPVNHSVIKAFDTLDLFGPDRTELTADAVARELQLSYATAHRFLATLETAGVLMSVRRGVFAPGPRLVRLGKMAEDLTPLPPRLAAILDALRTDLGESVMACRFTPGGPLCVGVSEAQRAISVNIRVGTTLPMLNTAQGRLFLAAMAPAELRAWAKAQEVSDTDLSNLAPALEDIKAHAHARNRGDNEPDIGAVSVPVIRDGRTSLTLSAFGMLSRFDAAFMDRAEARLKAAAKDLAAPYSVSTLP